MYSNSDGSLGRQKPRLGLEDDANEKDDLMDWKCGSTVHTDWKWLVCSTSNVSVVHLDGQWLQMVKAHAGVSVRFVLCIAWHCASDPCFALSFEWCFAVVR